MRDAERIRRELGVERWSVLGQSFGGLCVMTYLSLAPEGLREAFVTGGLPPIGRAHRRRLPRDLRAHARALPALLRAVPRRPRTGARAASSASSATTSGCPPATASPRRRLRQLGGLLGMSDGAEDLHYLLELPADSPAFRHDVEAALGFARNPLYAVLHEACWADGGATRWAAERLLPDDYADEPELLTGEHVFPWMFEEYAALAPLREAADLLAEHEWPRLYDADRLRRQRGPGRRRDLRRGPVRRARVLRGDRRRTSAACGRG